MKVIDDCMLKQEMWIDYTQTPKDTNAITLFATPL